MRTVRAGRDELLADKRTEMLENVRQCMEAVHTAAGGDPDAKNAVTRADAYYDDVKKKIDSFTSLLMLDGLLPQMLQYRDTACAKSCTSPASAPWYFRQKRWKPKPTLTNTSAAARSSFSPCCKTVTACSSNRPQAFPLGERWRRSAG